jgi:hypothetical protein
MKTKKIFLLSLLFLGQSSHAMISQKDRADYLKKFYQDQNENQAHFIAHHPIGQQNHIPANQAMQIEQIGLEAALKKLEMIKNLEKMALEKKNPAEKEAIYHAWKSFVDFMIHSEGNSALTELLIQRKNLFSNQLGIEQKALSPQLRQQIESFLRKIYDGHDGPENDPEMISFCQQLSPRTQLSFDLDVQKLKTIKALEQQQKTNHNTSSQTLEQMIEGLSHLLNFQNTYPGKKGEIQKEIFVQPLEKQGLSRKIELIEAREKKNNPNQSSQFIAEEDGAEHRMQAERLLVRAIESPGLGDNDQSFIDAFERLSLDTQVDLHSDLRKLSTIQLLENEKTKDSATEKSLEEPVTSLKNLLIFKDALFHKSDQIKEKQESAFSSHSNASLPLQEDTSLLPIKKEQPLATMQSAQELEEIEVSLEEIQKQTEDLLRKSYGNPEGIEKNQEFLRAYQSLPVNAQIDFDSDWKKIKTIQALQEEKQKDPQSFSALNEAILSLTDLLLFKNILAQESLYLPAVQKENQEILEAEQQPLPEQRPLNQTNASPQAFETDLAQEEGADHVMDSLSKLNLQNQKIEIIEPSLHEKEESMEDLSPDAFKRKLTDTLFNTYVQCYDTEKWLLPCFDFKQLAGEKKKLADHNGQILRKIISRSQGFYEILCPYIGGAFYGEIITLLRSFLTEEIPQISIDELRGRLTDHLQNQINLLIPKEAKAKEIGLSLEHKIHSLYQTFFKSFTNCDVDKDLLYNHAKNMNLSDDQKSLYELVLSRLFFLAQENKKINSSDLTFFEKTMVFERMIAKSKSVPLPGFQAMFLPFLEQKLSLADPVTKEEEIQILSIDRKPFEQKLFEKVSYAYNEVAKTGEWPEELLTVATSSKKEKKLLEDNLRILQRIIASEEDFYVVQKKEVGNFFPEEEIEFLQYLLNRHVLKFSTLELEDFFSNRFRSQIISLQEKKRENQPAVEELHAKESQKLLNPFYKECFKAFKSLTINDEEKFLSSTLFSKNKALSWSESEKKLLLMLANRVKYLVQSHEQLSQNTLALYHRSYLLKKMIAAAEGVPLQGFKNQFLPFLKEKLIAVVQACKQRDLNLSKKLSKVCESILNNYQEKTGIMPDYDEAILSTLSPEETDVFHTNISHIENILEKEQDFYDSADYTDEEELEFLASLKRDVKRLGGFPVLEKGFNKNLEERIEKLEKPNRILTHQQNYWIVSILEKSWHQNSSQKIYYSDEQPKQMVTNLFQSQVLKGYDNEYNIQIVSARVQKFFAFLNLLQKYRPTIDLAETEEEAKVALEKILDLLNIEDEGDDCDELILSVVEKIFQDVKQDLSQNPYRNETYYLNEKIRYENRQQKIDVTDKALQTNYNLSNAQKKETNLTAENLKVLDESVYVDTDFEKGVQIMMKNKK